MLSQDEIIGIHPEDPHIFYKCFSALDHSPKSNVNHRALESRVPANDPDMVDWLAKKIIEHHYKPELIDRLKKKFTSLGFSKYASKHRQIPVSDRTKKGNATEIILVEYIEACQGNRGLVKAFRLRYNPNVDQAMKGDDALMVDIVKDNEGGIDLKVFLGEAKFRGIPSNDVLTEISSSLGKDKLPLSYSFLTERLYEDTSTEDIAELLDGFLIEEIKAKGNLKYAGLLLSNTKVGNFVQNNFSCDNSSLVIISVGIDQPANLINNAFIKANALLSAPALL